MVFRCDFILPFSEPIEYIAVKWTSYRGFCDAEHVTNVYNKPTACQDTEGYQKLYDCWRPTQSPIVQGSYGSLKSMKVQDFLVVKIMYLNVLNFPETVEKSIKVHIKRV